MEKSINVVPQKAASQQLTIEELLAIKGGEGETPPPPAIVTDDLADL